jgi:aromatic ring-cleaving dioxygenase
MTDPDDAPYHAHVYFSGEQRAAAEKLRAEFQARPFILFVGRMTEGKAGCISTAAHWRRSGR